MRELNINSNSNALKVFRNKFLPLTFAFHGATTATKDKNVIYKSIFVFMEGIITKNATKRILSATIVVCALPLPIAVFIVMNRPKTLASKLFRAHYKKQYAKKLAH